MIAGARWMCCILSITEAGKQPEQPRSKTSRQFSISAVKLKSAAKLSEEFRLWTTNGKGNDTDIRREKKKWYFMILDSFLQLYHCIAIIPQQNQSQQIALEQLHSHSHPLENLGKSKRAERGGSEVIPHPFPFIPERNSQGPECCGYSPVF